MDKHTPRYWMTDRYNGWYTWKCTCGQHGARDYLTRDYAIDGWREAHNLEPITNYPQV